MCSLKQFLNYVIPLTLFYLINSTDATTSYKIDFDFKAKINLSNIEGMYRSLLANLTVSDQLKTTNVRFGYFPTISLYEKNLTKLMTRKNEIRDANTLYTIGGYSFYGQVFSNSRISTTVTNHFMQYLPISHVNENMQVNIIKTLYTKISEQFPIQRYQTMLVVDEKSLTGNLQILHLILNGNVRTFRYNGNTAEVLLKIRNSHVTLVILMIDSESTLKILPEIRSINLMNPNFMWIIVLPITSTIDITTFEYSSESPNITVVQLAQVSLPNNMTNATIINQQQKSNLNTPLSCLLSDILEVVIRLLENLLYNVETGTYIQGTTGNFEITHKNSSAATSPSAKRENWIIQIFHGIGSGAKVVGNMTISPDGNVTSFEMLPIPKRNTTDAYVLQKLRLNVFRIVTVLEEAFLMVKPNHTLNRNDRNITDKVEGFIIDITKALMNSLNIPYTVELDSSGQYGNVQPNGSWTGMINTVMTGRADMAAAGFVDTAVRRNAIDFITSHESFTASILFNKEKDTGVISLFQFVKPFHYLVWAMLPAVVIVVAIAMTILNCLNPNAVNFNIYESIFFFSGSIFQGVTNFSPDRASARILVSFFWFFSMIMLITYVAQYSATLTFERTTGKIVSLETLQKQNYYTYGTIGNSSYDEYFKKSNNEITRAMDRMMRLYFKNGYVKNVTFATKLVEEGGYAFIWDTIITQYIAYKNCLNSVGSFRKEPQAFIIPKNAYYKQLFDKHMKLLVRTGVISDIFAEYPYLKKNIVNPECAEQGSMGVIFKFFPRDFLKYSDDSLHLQNMFGILAIMVAGCFVILLMALIECICILCCQSIRRKRSRRPESTA